MDEIGELLIKKGFENQVEMASFINALDDRFGEGSGHRASDGKSWGEVTADDWRDDPSKRHISDGNKEEVLRAYAELRRGGVRGWMTITTQDWRGFSLWRPATAHS